MHVSELIATLRQSRGLSQDRLAEVLREVSGRATVTRSEVARWERGKRTPSPFWLRWLAVALEVPQSSLERATVTDSPLLPDDMGQTAVNDQLAQLAARYVLDSPWNATGTVASVAAVARGGPMDRRAFLIATGSVLSSVAATWAYALDGTSAASTTGSRHLAEDTVARLEQRLDDLRRLDDVLGGGDLRSLAVAEYQLMSELADKATYTDAVGRRLFSLLAEAARMCGWLHFDAGKHAGAQSYYLASLRASASAGDVGVGANTLAFMAIQTYSVGNPQDAVNLAQAAQGRASHHVTPRVRSMLHARTGRALSKTGDLAGTVRELDLARDAFADGDHDDDPPWVYWMTEGEIEMLAGSSALDLGDPRQALHHFDAAVGGGYGGYTRDNALFLSRAAQAHLAVGDVDAACATAMEAIAQNNDVDSNRASDAIKEFRELLSPHRDVRSVREFMSVTGS